MSAFSKIFEEETQTRLEDLNEAASGSINAIVSPLEDAIEKKTRAGSRHPSTPP